MYKPHFSSLIILCICILISSYAYGETADQIMLKSYNLDQGKDGVSDMEMRLISKSGKSRVREIRSWTIERGDEDKSLMKFLKPSSVKGTGFLVWEHKNKEDDQWLYLPAFKRVRRISSSEKDKSFMGTDFSYNDITQPHPDEFVSKLLGSEKVDGQDCYKIESIHKTYSGDPAYKGKKKYQYSKTTGWVRKDNYLMIKAVFFDKKGREFKQFKASDIEKIGGIWTPKKLEMENIKDKHKTVLTMKNIKYNIGLKNSFFSQRQLKSPR